MSDSLYPCRFCGNINIIESYQFNEYGDVYCSECDHVVSGHLTDFTAIKHGKQLWQARNEKHNPFLEDK